MISHYCVTVASPLAFHSSSTPPLNTLVLLRLFEPCILIVSSSESYCPFSPNSSSPNPHLRRSEKPDRPPAPPRPDWGLTGPTFRVSLGSPFEFNRFLFRKRDLFFKILVSDLFCLIFQTSENSEKRHWSTRTIKCLSLSD